MSFLHYFLSPSFLHLEQWRVTCKKGLTVNECQLRAGNLNCLCGVGENGPELITHWSWFHYPWGSILNTPLAALVQINSVTHRKHVSTSLHVSLVVQCAVPAHIQSEQNWVLNWETQKIIKFAPICHPRN